MNSSAVFAYLESLFGKSPRTELEYTSDIDLLVAIILSAQCTDKRVNMVTKELFKKYKTVKDYANADLETLRQEIGSINFFNNKAKNIIEMAKIVHAQHGGVIPADLETLTTLPGVGRKTASVFLVEFHNMPAMPVDTHVARFAKRLGFSKGKNVVEIERDLCEILPRENWADYHLLMVLFGRYYCKATKPECATCKLKEDGLCSWTK